MLAEVPQIESEDSSTGQMAQLRIRQPRWALPTNRWAFPRFSTSVFLAYTAVILLIAALQIYLVIMVSLRLRPDDPINGARNITSFVSRSDRLYPQPLMDQHLSYNLESLTTGIHSIPCHSHNDYLRPCPLFTALAAGCQSVEADIWADPNNKTNLLVGHTLDSLKTNHNLQDMYIQPLRAILNYRQSSSASRRAYGDISKPAGIYDDSPDTPFVLLLDFKNSTMLIWDAIQSHLDQLRAIDTTGHDYLQSWDETSDSLQSRPLVVVATGLADFAFISSSEKNKYRDIFYDAPLTNLSQTGYENPYNISNSYYASYSLDKAIGRTFSRWNSSRRPFSNNEMATLRSQVASAQSRGLKARYWETPTWPVALRVGVWRTLVENIGVDVLSVDEVWEAARWNWSWCQIMWISYC